MLYFGSAETNQRNYKVKLQKFFDSENSTRAGIILS